MTKNRKYQILLENIKLIISLTLALILCYFGLIAEGLNKLQSWEVGFIDSASPFFENLIDLYFMVWYNLIIILIGFIITGITLYYAYDVIKVRKNEVQVLWRKLKRLQNNE